MRTSTTLFRCLKFLGAFALIALAIGLTASTASAQGTCLQDEYNLVSKQSLGCTAGDVKVAKVINIRNPDGSALFTCTGGQTLPFVADFLVQTTANATNAGGRSNVGLYISNFDVSQQSDALTGSCTDNVIAPPHHSAGIAACLGSGASADASCTGCGTYEEFDTAHGKTPAEPSVCNGLSATGCGDTSSTDHTVCLSAPDAHGEQVVQTCTAAQKSSCTDANNCFPGTQVVTVEIPAFHCPELAAGSQVTLPNCTSWQTPGSNIFCTASPSDYQYSYNNPTAIPGTPSKCHCEAIAIPLIVQTPNFIVQKACNVPDWKGNNTTQGASPNPPTFNPTATPPTQSPTICDAGPENNFQTVTYTINIHNASTGTGGVTVKQLCDSEYGTIYRATGYNGAFCGGAASQPPFTGNAGSITCPSTGTLDIPFGGDAQCTFTATPSAENLGQGTNGALSDQASAIAVGDVSGSTVGPFGSNTVLVDTEDAPTSAETTPSPNALAQVCARETFHATVKNDSGNLSDETIYISGLADTAPNNLTQLSAAGGPIVGTTCGVQASLGTLSGSPAKPFPAGGIAPGGTYECDFDVFFCATPTSQTVYGTCSAGVCTAGGPTPAGGCTTNDQCNTTCTGIATSETLNATLAGDETQNGGGPNDTISPITNHMGSVSVCVQTSTSIQ